MPAEWPLAIINRAKTECPQGHPYDEENTGRSRNKRYCKICHRAKSARWRAEHPGQGYDKHLKKASDAAYYKRNRDRILARKKARKEAAK